MSLSPLSILPARRRSSPDLRTASGSPWRGAWRRLARELSSTAATRASWRRPPNRSKRADGPALARAFDVADEAQVHGAFAHFDAAGVEIDILVNNAGIELRKPMLDLKTEEWRRVVDTHLTGSFQVGREAARRMIARGRGGKIINIASLASEVARATIAPYVAAKGGVRMLTRSMAAEWARYDIQANAIGPGYIATEINRALLDDPKFDAWVKGRTPSGRWANRTISLA